MSVHIDQIRTDGGTQARAATNQATVAEYAEAMADPNTVFPPVIVYFDGKDYWLADGFHRLAAWKQIGRTDIPTDIRQGDRRRAVLHSVAANSAHGLRRTNDDKRRAVLTLLEDDEWAQWSNREIAKRCAVSEGFVRSLRSVRSDEQPQERTFTTKHGTQATMQTANIGAVASPSPQAGTTTGTPPSRPKPGKTVKNSQTETPVEYLAHLLLYADQDWDRLEAALYQVSTSEIREYVLDAISSAEEADR